jgi:hypothetical protein
MRKFLLLSILVLVNACSTLNVQRLEGGTPRGPFSEKKLHQFVFGFVPTRRNISESELCNAGKVESMQMEMSGVDVLVAVVTAGIYVPQRLRYNCSITSPSQ